MKLTVFNFLYLRGWIFSANIWVQSKGILPAYQCVFCCQHLRFYNCHCIFKGRGINSFSAQEVFYYVFNGLRLYKTLFQKHMGRKYFMIINSIKGTMVLNIPVDSLQLEDVCKLLRKFRFPPLCDYSSQHVLSPEHIPNTLLSVQLQWFHLN